MYKFKGKVDRRVQLLQINKHHMEEHVIKTFISFCLSLRRFACLVGVTHEINHSFTNVITTCISKHMVNLKCDPIVLDTE